MRIGIIGVGAIGSVIASYIDKELPHHKLVAICDIDKLKAKRVRDSLKNKPVITDIEKVIKKSDLVIEAVSPDVVKKLLLTCIKHKKHLMVMSVGGLIPNLSLLDRLTARLFVPSGAICGIDGVKAAQTEKITSVTITSTKSPRSLAGAPFIEKHRINLNKIKTRKVLFEGPVIKAVKYFPKNVNVSAVLSLAGIGAKKTKVKVVVDPKIKRNMHEVEVEGTFGKLYTRTENILSPLNPKTSHMAVLSACATLKRLTGHVKIGN